MGHRVTTSPDDKQGCLSLAGESTGFTFHSSRPFIKTLRMEAEQNAPFRIWAVDNVVYGPVDLPTLVEWVKDERVTAETWVFNDEKGSWFKAPQIPELKDFFRPPPVAEPEPSGPAPTFKLGSLRRVKILADMNDGQLERFVKLMEVKNIRQWTQIVRQGDAGDAMYLVLEGELRVRMMINGKETILATLNAGEFFGDIALFDQGPRSADVVSNKDSVLLKISAASFEKLLTQAPDLAAPFLFAIGKTLAARIRADNKRIKDSVNFARMGGY
jgi:hypothetical protein